MEMEQDLTIQVSQQPTTAPANKRILLALLAGIGGMYFFLAMGLLSLRYVDMIRSTRNAFDYVALLFIEISLLAKAAAEYLVMKKWVKSRWGWILASNVVFVLSLVIWFVLIRSFDGILLANAGRPSIFNLIMVTLTFTPVLIGLAYSYIQSLNLSLRSKPWFLFSIIQWFFLYLSVFVLFAFAIGQASSD